MMCYTAFIFYPRWEKNTGEATISWDVSGYYMYLPAIFVYNDLKQLEFGDSILHQYKPSHVFDQAFVHEGSGNKVMKYPSGQALVMLPFFGIAHIWASLDNTYRADGFSYPYQVCIGVGMLLVAFIGLIFFRRVLRQFYDDKIVAIALLALVFGTNYLNFAAIDQAMTHSGLFTIYSILIYCSIKFYQKPNIKIAIIIGILCGWATLIRPTEILSLIIPIFWGISSLKQIKERFSFLYIHKYKLLTAGFCFVAMVSIQVIYWKYVSGDWIVYSYQNQGFSFLKPHYYPYTWSYHSGWLRYTPMMILAFIGLIPFIRNKKNTFPITAFFLINYYIVMSWDVWDYGGRAMMQSYPILFFPFCALIAWFWEKRYLRIICIGILLFCSYLNIWWTYFSHRQGVQVAHIGKAYYWKKVGRWTTANEFDKKLLDNRDSYYGYPIAADTIKELELIPTLVIKAPIDTIVATINNYGQTKKWLRFIAFVNTPEKEWEVWKQPQFIVRYFNKGKEIKHNMIHLSRFIEANESKEIFMDSKLPKQNWDSLNIQFWTPSNNSDLFIQTIKVITFDK